jgi:hypothetical protein
MGPDGPPPITRLVLAGHVLFMDRDGSRCWVGVRRLAVVTGLNKETVAKHRAAALAAGWLMAGRQHKHSPVRQVYASLPDGLPMPEEASESGAAGHPSGALSSGAGQSPSRYPQLSGGARQSGPKSAPQLYGPNDSTVRPERSNCPVGPDVPPYISLSPLNEGARFDGSPKISSPTTEEEIKAAKLRLAAWLSINGRAQRFRDQLDTLVGLVPLANRFLGYQDFIRTIIEAATAPSPQAPDTQQSAELPTVIPPPQ